MPPSGWVARTGKQAQWCVGVFQASEPCCLPEVMVGAWGGEGETRSGGLLESRANVLSHFTCVRLFATLCTIARQAPLSMGFSRQEYWTGLPCPPPGDLPDPGIEPRSPQILYCLSHQGSPRKQRASSSTCSLGLAASRTKQDFLQPFHWGFSLLTMATVSWSYYWEKRKLSPVLLHA